MLAVGGEAEVQYLHRRAAVARWLGAAAARGRIGNGVAAVEGHLYRPWERELKEGRGRNGESIPWEKGSVSALGQRRKEEGGGEGR